MAPSRVPRAAILLAVALLVPSAQSYLTCNDTSSSHYQACETSPALPVCGQHSTRDVGDTYKNIECAFCDGCIRFNDGACPVVISSCPAGPCPDEPSTDEYNCERFSYTPYCGEDQKTYKNRYCARCNGLSRYTRSVCPVNATVAVDKCNSVNCPANAECYTDELDCAFELGDVSKLRVCNALSTTTWAVESKATAAAKGKAAPPFDHTYGTRKEGHVLLASPSTSQTLFTVRSCSVANRSKTCSTASSPVCGSDLRVYLNADCAACNDATVVKPYTTTGSCGATAIYKTQTAPSTANGYQCRIKAWANVNGAGSHLTVFAVDLANGARSQRVVDVTAGVDVSSESWIYSTISLGLFTDVRVRFEVYATMNVSDPTAYVALDDMDYSCGDLVNTDGDCRCLDGFVNVNKTGLTCEKEGTDPPPPLAVVNTCRPGSSCLASKACEESDGTKPVCVAGTQYKSRECALCNWEDSHTITAGVCTPIPTDNEITSQCFGTSTTAKRYQSSCARSTSSPVCAGNRNYKNRYCAYCNDMFSSTVKAGFCSHVSSSYTEQVNATCPATASSYYKQQCQSRTGLSPVCSSPGKQNYKDFYCARCNNVRSYSTGLCQDATASSAVVVAECLKNSSTPRYEQLCNTSSFRPVCAQGHTYRNSYCARCNDYSSGDYKFGECASYEFDVVDTCNGATHEQCLFFDVSLVCADDGKTYKNKECAVCNGVDATKLVDGSCAAEQNIEYDSCDSVECAEHASCAREIADCNFEDDQKPLCGWFDGTQDTLNWTLHSGATSTEKTGPSVDHSIGTKAGHYLYVEASGQFSGATAHLLSPFFDTTDAGNTCRLEFWYHMWGHDIGKLGVELRKKNFGQSWNTVWQVASPADGAEEVHNKWKKAVVPLTGYSGSSVQARVWVKTGSATGGLAKGDVAIDDLELVCGEQARGDCECEVGYSGDGFHCTLQDPKLTTTTAKTTTTTTSPNPGKGTTTTTTTTGGPTTAPTKAKAKSNGTTIAAVIVVILVLIGGGIFGYVYWRRRQAGQAYTPSGGGIKSSRYTQFDNDSDDEAASDEEMAAFEDNPTASGDTDE